MKGSFAAYLSGIEQALAPQRGFLVGDNVTLADVCFVSELCLFHNERARSSALKTAGFSLLLDNEFAKSFPRSAAIFGVSWDIQHLFRTSPVTWKRSKGVMRAYEES